MCPRWRVGVGPQEAARISKLKNSALKVVSQILPVKLAFTRLKEDANFSKLPKPLVSKLLDAGKTLVNMSEEADARASGKSGADLPFGFEDVKEAIAVCIL